MSEQVGRRKCVFVISDFFTDLNTLFDGVKRLLYRNCEVIFLHVLDPLELDFNIDGQVELIELEGEGRLQIEGQSMRASYNKEFAAFLADLRNRALAMSEEDIEEGRTFDQITLNERELEWLKRK
jgi:hypothetical protein